MSTVQVITEATLGEIPYHELKNKLEELGLGSVWIGGKKKVDMIKEAIAKINEVKEMQEKKLSQENIDKMLVIRDAEKLAEKSAINEKKLAEKKLLEDKELDKARDSVIDKGTQKYSIEKLQRALTICKANLKNGAENHRKVLMKKKQQITALLKEAGVDIE